MPGVSFIGYLSIASAKNKPFFPTEPEARLSGALLLGEPNGWRAKVVILWGKRKAHSGKHTKNYGKSPF